MKNTLEAGTIKNDLTGKSLKDKQLYLEGVVSMINLIQAYRRENPLYKIDAGKLFIKAPNPDNYFELCKIKDIKEVKLTTRLGGKLGDVSILHQEDDDYCPTCEPLF